MKSLFSVGLLPAISVLLTGCFEDELPKRPVRLLGYGTPMVLVVSPDGRSFVTGGPGQAVLREIETGRVLQAFMVVWPATMVGNAHPLTRTSGLVDVRAAAVSPDGRLLATGDNTVQLWEIASGQRLAFLEGPTDGTAGLAFSADGTMLARAGHDATIRLWAMPSRQILRTFAAHTNLVSSLTFSKDGKRMLTASRDGSVRLWEVASGALLQAFAAGGNVHSATFSADNAQLVAGSVRWDAVRQLAVPEIKWFDAMTGAVVHSLELTGMNLVSHFSEFSSDGARVLTTGADGAARLWDSRTGQLLRAFKPPDGVGGAGFTPDGQRVLTMSGEQGVAQAALWIWDTETGDLLRQYGGYATALNCLAFSPDGTRAATGTGWPAGVGIWETSTGTLLREFAHTNEVRAVAFSPDGSQILTGGLCPTTAPTAGDSGFAWVWDVNTGQRLVALEETSPVNSVAFSPDGTRVLLGLGSWDDMSGGRGAALWDVARRLRLHTYRTNSGVSIYSIAFAPDGREFLPGDGSGEVNLWDVATGSLLRSFPSPKYSRHWGPRASVAFSPDGRKVLVKTGNADCYDRETGRLLTTFPIALSYSIDYGEEFPPGVAVFSPTGSHVLTAVSYEGAGYGQIWNVETGASLGGLIHGGPPAAFSPDGNHVLTGGPGFAALWDIRDVLAELRIQKSHSGFEVSWRNGQLQYGPSVLGPWTNLSAASPYKLSPSGPAGFFRVKVE